MAEGFIEKTKGFFGFGAIDSFDDRDYPRDDFQDDFRDDFRDDDRREERRPVHEDHYGAPSGRHADPAPTREHSRYGRPESARPGAALGDRVPGRPAVAEPAVVPARTPELVIVEVREYRDVNKVTPEYRRGDIVGFNLSDLDKAEGLQFLAYVGGLAAGLDGKVEKIGGSRNFALLPEGIRLNLDQRDTLESRLSGER
ncbi:cell division protein SepF [Corynebacterium sp.]|jgi:cell division inhibitor SepF|uniref:cell division protein SepF n=1 Tax=Corynebacterium sp. TaxID=1720 RepID=UPI0025BD3E1A|nr:cell division protein SepF [Corynebacterium sp.]